MPRNDDLYSLPPNLPVPADDGAAAHLRGMRVPSISLPATRGGMCDLSALKGTTVVYAYPRTGVPDKNPPAGWDLIPGMRGCTPQSCAFRDHYTALRARGAEIFGLSTQTTEYQSEAAGRLHLPFALLSDASLALTRALRLPTITIESTILLRRLTMIIRDGSIAHVFYPVFPPDKNAEAVLAWLERE